jgi:hypothetical protein
MLNRPNTVTSRKKNRNTEERKKFSERGRIIAASISVAMLTAILQEWP